MGASVAVGMDRQERTTDKARGGGLPAPPIEPPEIGAGNGTPCDGCTETIHPTERMCTVNVYGVATLRFHDSCHRAWITCKT
jgi:hypothetical protein